MKKALVLGILGLAAAATQSFGQGQIIFANYYSSTQTTGATYGNGPAAGLGLGPEMTATLLWGASGATSVSNVVAGSAIAFGLGAATGPGAFGTGAGWFSAGKVTINGGVAGNYAFQIEATGTYQGQTYTGFSPVVTGPTTASSSSPVPNLPNSLWKGNFTAVAPIPEPSIIALCGIGAAALMVSRRKKVS